MNAGKHQLICARVVEGHRVASGQNGNPRFPGGTLRMQAPHFHKLGFEIGHLYLGTLNVSIAPRRYRVVQPKRTFRQLRWHPTEPAEDFSFFDVRILRQKAPPEVGYIYYPHPETKPEHFQAPDVLELLAPFMPGMDYGLELQLEIPQEQMLIDPPDAASHATVQKPSANQKPIRASN